MPQIPFSPQELPGVRPSTPESPVPTVEALGGSGPAPSPNRAIQQTAGAVESLAMQAQQQANQIAVADRDRKAAAIESSVLTDPDNGALNKYGADAFPAYHAALDAFDKGSADLASTLTTTEQRNAFASRIAERRQALNDRLQFHVGKERKAWDDQVTGSYVSNETDNASQAAGEPNYHVTTDTAAKRISETIWGWGGRNGQLTPRLDADGNAVKDEAGNPVMDPSDALQEQIRTARSKLYTGVISNLLAKKMDQEAQAFYKDNATEIDGKDQPHVLASLREGDLRGKSQRTADNIVATSKDEADALTKLTDISDPELRDETQRRVTQSYAMQKQASRDHSDALYAGSMKMMQQNPGKDVRDVIPPSVLPLLSKTERQAAYDMANPPKSSDPRATLAFNGALMTGEMKDMTRPEFEQKILSKLNAGDRAQAEEAWSGFKSADANPKLTSTVDTAKQATDALVKSDLVPGAGKLNNDQAKTKAAFLDDVNVAIQNYESSSLGGKRHANAQEKQDIINKELSKRVFVSRRFLPDKEVVASVVSPGDADRAYVPIGKIPDNHQAIMASKLKSFGRPVDPAVMQRAYASYLMNDTASFNAILAGTK